MGALYAKVDEIVYCEGDKVCSTAEVFVVDLVTGKHPVDQYGHARAVVEANCFEGWIKVYKQDECQHHMFSEGEYVIERIHGRFELITPGD